MVSLYDIGKQVPEPIAHAGANAYILLNRILTRNYHKFEYSGREFRYEYRDYRTFTELHGAIRSDETTDEGAPLNLFDLEDRDIALDIGAHFGLHTVLLAVLNPDIPVYAFEPTEDNVDVLKHNMKANNLGAPRVQVYQKAVTNHDSTVTFYQDREFQGSTRDTIHPPSETDSAFERVKVDAVSLSSLLNKNEFARPFLKIDAEGAELEILEDLTRSYEGDAEGIVEIHADRIDGGEGRILDLLEDGGYVYDIVEDESSDRRTYSFWKDNT